MLAADHQGCASSFRTGDPFHSRKYLLGTCLPPQNKAAIFVIYFWRTLFCHLLRYSILATITYCSTLQLFFLLPNPHVPIPIHSMAVLRPTPFTNHCAKPPSITFFDACIWIPTLQNRFYALPCVPFSASRTSSLITLCRLDVLKCVLRPIGSSYIILQQPDGPWQGCASHSDHLCMKRCVMARVSSALQGRR